MKKIFVPFTAIALWFTFSAGAFAENHSKTLTLEQQTQVNGTTLRPGDYKVEWDGNGPSTQLKFFNGKKQVATAPAQVKELSKKTNDTAVILGNRGNVPTLDEIDFGGTNQAFVLSNQSGTQASGQ